MSESNEELVRRGYEAWNTGDRSWVLEHMRPDVEWIPPPDDPDHRIYRGYEGVQEFWDRWRSAVGQLSFAPLEITSHGEEVIVTARRQGRGMQSGLEVADEVIQVFSFDAEGRCARVREFYDRAQAMDSVSSSGEANGDARADG